MALAFIILLASLYGHMRIGPNNDHIIQLNQAASMLNGGTPYTDFSDVNTPLTYLLYAIPAWFSSLTNLSSAICLWLFTYALEAVSLICSYRILRASGLSALSNLATLLTLALALTTISFQHQVFGDREQLALILVTPWLLLYSPIVQQNRIPHRWRLTVALLAAFSFALKPYFLFFYITTLIAKYLQKRPMDWLAHSVIATMLATYAMLIALFFPAYYFETLPLLWYTYDASCWSFTMRFQAFSSMFYHYWPILFFSALALLFPRAELNKQLLYLAGLIAAAAIAFLAGQGWYFTQYPLIALCFVFAVSGCTHMLKANIANTGERIPTFIIILILAICIVSQSFYPCYMRAMADINSQTYSHHPLAIASSDVQSNALLDRHLGPTSRYMFLGTALRALSFQKYQRLSIGRYDSLWPLYGLMQLRDAPSKEYQYNVVWPIFIKGLIQDITLKTPDRIIVDASPEQIPLPLNTAIIPFLEKDAAFKAAMKPYQLKDIIDTCHKDVQAGCAFKVYYRKTLKPSNHE